MLYSLSLVLLSSATSTLPNPAHLPAAGDPPRLARVFTDHMVLQRDRPVPIWGWADPAAEVEVRFAGQRLNVTAAGDGRWRVDLASMPMNRKPQVLEVEANGVTRCKNVLVGDVWLCAGQSNMNREAKVVEPDPEVRLFWIDGSVVPQEQDLGKAIAGWVPSVPSAVAAAAPTMRRGRPHRRSGFAEVGYVFGRRIHAELGVPIGLIKCAFGGSQVAAWTPDPTLAERVPFGQPAKGSYLGHRRGLLYRSMVHGLVPFSIRGVLWYQGENDGRSKVYAEHLKTWINSWRELWRRPALPFYMVQIAPTSYAGGRMQFIWEAQCQIMHTVPHTALAVSNDIYLHGKRPAAEVIDGVGKLAKGMRPSNPHPPNKHVVAERLAQIALVKTYRQKARPIFGPMLQSLEIDGDEVVVRFRYVADGLKTRDGKAPDWFELSDGSKEKGRLVFHRAVAEIRDPSTILVKCADVPSPKFLRFAWHCTAIHNLQNSAGLPAVSFRTDDANR